MMSFDLTEFMSEKSMNFSQNKSETVMLPVSKLVPAGGNFYSKDEERVRKLAATIEVLATEEQSGVQDNLVVKKIDGKDQYEILAGETRWSAVRLLLDEGRIKSEMVPCRVETSGDAVREELILIFTNSTQRVRSDAEKMHEIERLRELLSEYKKSHSLGGTVQQAIADILSVSKSKVGTLEHINRKLIKPLMKMYEEGKIPTSVANRIAGFEDEEQKSFANYAGYTKTDYITGEIVDTFHISYMHRDDDAEQADDEESDSGAVVVSKLETTTVMKVEENGISFQLDMQGEEAEKLQETEEVIAFQLDMREKSLEREPDEEPVEQAESKKPAELSSAEVRRMAEEAVAEFFSQPAALDMLDKKISEYEDGITIELRCIKKIAEKCGKVPDVGFIRNSGSYFKQLCLFCAFCTALSEYRNKLGTAQENRCGQNFWRRTTGSW